MPKTLILLRHGKTHHGSYDRDHDRELKHRGEVQAKNVGAELRRRNLLPERIIASSAVRARSSAGICAKSLRFEGEIELLDELYGISAQNLLRFAAALNDETDTVLLVGHNPAFEEAASLLAGRSTALGTGDCAVLVFAAASWTALREGEAPEQFELLKSD